MACIEQLLHKASGLYMWKHGGGRAVGTENKRPQKGRGLGRKKIGKANGRGTCMRGKLNE